jgi:predicted amidohydrolase
LIRRKLLIAIVCGQVACSAPGAADWLSCDLHPRGETRVEDCAVRNPDGSLSVSREVLAELPFGDDGVAAVWIDETGRRCPRRRSPRNN